MFPPRFLSAHELEGKEHKMTIKAVSDDKVKDESGGEEVVYVVYFEKAKKGMVLNKTNTKLIESQHGTETDDWIGKEITIWPTTCMAFGEKVDCIRVKRGKRGGRL